MVKILRMIVLALFWLVVGCWLLVVAPPWLAFVGILVWLKDEQTWWLRAAIPCVLGLAWSLASGFSPILGVSFLLLMFWTEQLSRGWLTDLRWRILIISGLSSLCWAGLAQMNWTLGILLWWMMQGVVARWVLGKWLHPLHPERVLFREPAVEEGA